MRPDLILHIGQSKTGTSSIQRCLGARREELLDLGVFYPRSPGAANHGLLPASLVDVAKLHGFNPALWEGLSPEARLAAFRSEFAQEMSAIDPRARTVIISAEQCGGLLTNEESISRLRDVLAPYVNQVRVLIYLRRQDMHYASSFTQALRVAVIRPAALPESDPEDLPGYDYEALLRPWAAVFGEEALRPRIFEPAALLNRDVVDDFFAACGLDVRVPKDDPARQSNLAISAEGIALVEAMGTYMMTASPAGLSADSLVWRGFVQSVSQAMPGRGWRPTAEESAAFMGRFEASNEAVRRRWFPDRPRLFDESDLAAAKAAAVRHGGRKTEPRVEDAAATLRAACELIAWQVADARQREAEHAMRVGRLHERLGSNEAARASYTAALRAVPDFAAAHFHLGRMAVEDGDTQAALARLEALRRWHPNHETTARLERKLRMGQV